MSKKYTASLLAILLLGVGFVVFVFSAKHSVEVSISPTSDETLTSAPLTSEQAVVDKVSKSPLDVNASKEDSLSLFEKHNRDLVDAQNGDDNAQYRLSISLRDCGWDTKPSAIDIEDQINQLVEAGINATDQFFDDLRAKAKECAPIYDYYSGKALYNVRQAWLSEAASNGNTYALLDLAFTQVEKFQDLEFKNHVRNLLNEAVAKSREDSMEAIAINKALLYRTNMQEISETTDVFDKTTSDWALRLAECEFIKKSRSSCHRNFVTEHEISPNYFLDPNLEESKKKMDILVSALEDKSKDVVFDIESF